LRGDQLVALQPRTPDRERRLVVRNGDEHPPGHVERRVSPPLSLHGFREGQGDPSYVVCVQPGHTAERRRPGSRSATKAPAATTAAPVQTAGTSPAAYWIGDE